MKIENEYIANIRLALPVMLGQSANVLTGLVDNYMLARLGGNEGELALSAGATAGAVFILVLLVGTGISCGMTPFVAFSHAQKDSKEIDRIFRNGWVMNACIGIIFAMLLYVTAPLLSHPALGQVDEITSLAIPYLRIVGFSLIPVMIFQSYKQTIDGLGNTWMGMVAVILSNVVNIIANYALIYGNWGFEKLGVEGAAWGTFISRVALVMIMIFITAFHRDLKHFIRINIFKGISWKPIRKILGIGIPTGMQMLFEMGVFSAAALLAGRYGQTYMSAHQIAAQVTGLTYTFVSGMAVAATIRVSHYLGLGDIMGIRRASRCAYVMVVGLMGIFGLCYVIFNEDIPALFFERGSDVVAYTAPLFIYAAIFELFDGIQVVSQGALRGLQDVKIPTAITAAGYWAVAFPLAVILGVWCDMKTEGIWIGLASGLIFCAIMLTLRLVIMMRHIKVKYN